MQRQLDEEVTTSNKACTVPGDCTSDQLGLTGVLKRSSKLLGTICFVLGLQHGLDTCYAALF